VFDLICCNLFTRKKSWKRGSWKQMQIRWWGSTGLN